MSFNSGSSRRVESLREIIGSVPAERVLEELLDQGRIDIENIRAAARSAIIAPNKLPPAPNAAVFEPKNPFAQARALLKGVLAKNSGKVARPPTATPLSAVSTSTAKLFYYPPEAVLTDLELVDLFKSLQARFNANMHRHPDLSWPEIKGKLNMKSRGVVLLYNLHRHRAEPDIIGYDAVKRTILVETCSVNTPFTGVAFDETGQFTAKSSMGSAMDLARKLGCRLISTSEYISAVEREKAAGKEIDKSVYCWLMATEDFKRKHPGNNLAIGTVTPLGRTVVTPYQPASSLVKYGVRLRAEI